MNTFAKITRTERNNIIARASEIMNNAFASNVCVSTANFTFKADVCKNRKLANVRCYETSTMSFISKAAHKRLVSAIV